MPRNGNNADAAARNVERVVQAGLRNAERALPTIGQRIQHEVQVSLSSPAAPSAPGTPPARRTGGLQASWQTETGRDARGRPYVAIFSRHRAAAPLEYGTSDTPARPTLRPAVERELPRIGPTIGRAFAEGVRAAARKGTRGR